MKKTPPSCHILCMNYVSRQPLYHLRNIWRLKDTALIALTLLYLFLNIPSAAAQTQIKRAGSNAKENLQRVDDKKRAGGLEASRRDSAKLASPPPLVRKTALTYAPQRGNQSVMRPVLINDIKIVSRVGSESPTPVGLITAAKPRGGLASVPSIWPVAGTLRSGYGVRDNPFGGSSTEFHKGQDIRAPLGAPVIATADGTVVIAGWQRGYGRVVYIDHGNGMSTRYGHLSRIDVTAGQNIRRGEQLGLVGSTGRSTGPHLHYEVRINGQPISPINYLPSISQPSSAP
jgi:murein DD-endopeptidase MepM/ murein hydrolase activator NlpD